VQIADLLCRQAKVGHSGNLLDVTEDDWLAASGWDLLFNQNSETEKSIARASLKRSLDRLSAILEGLV
jgi:hypothetical protein